MPKLSRLEVIQTGSRRTVAPVLLDRGGQRGGSTLSIESSWTAAAALPPCRRSG